MYMKVKKNSLPIQWLFILGFAYIFTSCANDAIPSLERQSQAIGMLNQATIVADKDIWEGAPGDSLRSYMEAPFPIMPQPEPIFNIQHFSGEQVLEDPNRKHLRTLIFLADLSDTDSPTTGIVRNGIGDENVLRAKEESSFGSIAIRDKWARGQLIIYVFGHGEEKLANSFVKHYPAIAKRIRDIDAKMLYSQTYLKGESKRHQELLEGKFNMSMIVPADYIVAHDESDVIWMRKETRNLSSNILIHKIPYTDKEQLSEEGLKSIRDALGKKYVTTIVENSYMRVNDVDLPTWYKNKTVGDNFAIEARGIWEIKGDFMGGPFISYLIHNADKNELVFVDGFIHAPSKPKRNFMNHLELIFSSIKFI